MSYHAEIFILSRMSYIFWDDVIPDPTFQVIPVSVSDPDPLNQTN
jgi:hypothetical protein